MPCHVYFILRNILSRSHCQFRLFCPALLLNFRPFLINLQYLRLHQIASQRTFFVPQIMDNPPTSNEFTIQKFVSVMTRQLSRSECRYYFNTFFHSKQIWSFNSCICYFHNTHIYLKIFRHVRASCQTKLSKLVQRLCPVIQSRSCNNLNGSTCNLCCEDTLYQRASSLLQAVLPVLAPSAVRRRVANTRNLACATTGPLPANNVVWVNNINK